MKAFISTPLHRYIAVWFALLGLLALTWGMARLDLGRFNAAVALGIAATKALLVLMYFMHLRDERKTTWLFAVAGVYWFALMVALTLGDYLTRSGGAL